jgi:hypothetical protein
MQHGGIEQAKIPVDRPTPTPGEHADDRAERPPNKSATRQPKVLSERSHRSFLLRNRNLRLRAAPDWG